MLMTYTRQPMVNALEWIAGFYAFVGAWIGLSVLGATIADRLERHGPRGQRA